MSKLLPPLTVIPRDLVAAVDYERHARQHLDDNAWEYLSGGAADEITLHENRVAFDRLRLRSRVLADVKGGHTQLNLFGHRYAHPLFLAPLAYQRLFHADGELATALAADAMQAGMVVSTLASVRMEELPAPVQSARWFQLYFQADRAATLALLRRAEACGFSALLVTVDAPLAGIRNREQRAGFALPDGVAAVNLETLTASSAVTGSSVVFDVLMANAPGWADIEWLLGQTRLPVLLKGVLDAEDAKRALSCGIAGIVVSNHGGRVLDTLPASIDALPAVVTALEGKIPVLLDGGIRRGTDVFKALALGADAVLLGRPYIYALATAGALGVAHLLRTLREELEITMALCGCKTLEDIGPHVLFRSESR
ncbi:MAG: alpha-hydroxy acid oxidase [Moraxellaceae bacterium]